MWALRNPFFSLFAVSVWMLLEVWDYVCFSPSFYLEELMPWRYMSWLLAHPFRNLLQLMLPCCLLKVFCLASRKQDERKTPEFSLMMIVQVFSNPVDSMILWWCSKSYVNLASSWSTRRESICILLVSMTPSVTLPNFLQQTCHVILPSLSWILPIGFLLVLIHLGSCLVFLDTSFSNCLFLPIPWNHSIVLV